MIIGFLSSVEEVSGRLDDCEWSKYDSSRSHRWDGSSVAY